MTFSSYPLWLNGLLFLISSAVIWWAGTRLERHADTIAERTGLGQASVASACRRRSRLSAGGLIAQAAKRPHG